MHAHFHKNSDTAVHTDPVCHRNLPADSPFFVDDDGKRTVFCDPHCRATYISRRRDPVCGMRLAGPTPYTLQEGNKQVWFCSIDCRALYLEQENQNR